MYIGEQSISSDSLNLFCFSNLCSNLLVLAVTLLAVFCQLQKLLHNVHPQPECLYVIVQKSSTLSEQQLIARKECRETFLIMSIYNLSAGLVLADDYWVLRRTDLPPPLNKPFCWVSYWLMTFLKYRSFISYKFHGYFPPPILHEIKLLRLHKYSYSMK